MILETFAQGDSPLHRLDPRVKLLFAVALSMLAALAERPASLALAAAAPAIALASARLPWRAVARRIALINSFILLVWLIVPFTTPGPALATWGPIRISDAGARFAALITIRSNITLLTMMAFLGTSNVFSLAHALSHLRAPDKLIHLLYFCYRYLHVFHEEYLRLRGAMKARAFRPRMSRHAYKTFGYLIGMLLARGHWRAGRVRAAMLCRGFTGRFAPLEHFQMRGADWAAAAIMASYALLILAVEWKGRGA